MSRLRRASTKKTAIDKMSVFLGGISNMTSLTLEVGWRWGEWKFNVLIQAL